MERLRVRLSSDSGRAVETPSEDDVIAVTGILSNWPSLSRAVGRYEHRLAEQFSTLAYQRVQAGLIRLEDRRALAETAEYMGIRPFDAQILIACALRKWAMDHRFDEAVELPAELSAHPRRPVWVKVVFIMLAALMFDLVLLWLWFA